MNVSRKNLRQIIRTKVVPEGIVYTDSLGRCWTGSSTTASEEAQMLNALLKRYQPYGLPKP